jgi:hypothetical protein
MEYYETIIRARPRCAHVRSTGSSGRRWAPAMDAIYEDLRDEFDLGDRFNALELKRSSSSCR